MHFSFWWCFFFVVNKRTLVGSFGVQNNFVDVWNVLIFPAMRQSRCSTELAVIWSATIIISMELFHTNKHYLLTFINALCEDTNRVYWYESIFPYIPDEFWENYNSQKMQQMGWLGRRERERKNERSVCCPCVLYWSTIVEQIFYLSKIYDVSNLL